MWPKGLEWNSFAYLRECGFDGPIAVNQYDYWAPSWTDVSYQWPQILNWAHAAGMKVDLQTGEIGLTNPWDGVELLRPVASHPAIHSVVIFDEPAWNIEKRALRGYTHENFTRLVTALRAAYPVLKLNVVQAGMVLDDTAVLKRYSQEVDFIGADHYEELGPSTMERLGEVALGKPIYQVCKYANDRDVNNLKAAIQGSYDGGAHWVQWYAEPSDNLTIDSPAWQALIVAVRWASEYLEIDIAARNMVAAWR